MHNTTMQQKTGLWLRTSARSVQGFTLLEVVIVLFVIGIATAIAIPNLFPSNRVQINDQSTRLLLLLTRPRDNAIAQVRPMSVSFTETGYQFWQAPSIKPAAPLPTPAQAKSPEVSSAQARPPIDWKPSDDTELQAVVWPEGIRLYALQVDGVTVQDKTQKWVLSPSGINPILRIELQWQDEQGTAQVRQAIETDPLGRIELKAAN